VAIPDACRNELIQIDITGFCIQEFWHTCLFFGGATPVGESRGMGAVHTQALAQSMLYLDPVCGGTGVIALINSGARRLARQASGRAEVMAQYGHVCWLNTNSDLPCKERHRMHMQYGHSSKAFAMEKAAALRCVNGTLVDEG